MAYTITGKILVIGNIESIPYQDNVFRKRELVLDASRFNSITGEQYPNFPKFEVGGSHVDELSSFQVGQLVTVTFAVSGRRTEKNGQVGYFTNLQAYKFELYQRYNNQSQGYNHNVQAGSGYQPTNYPQQGTQSVQSPNNVGTQQSAPVENLPPALDQNGMPTNPEKDDLPF